MSKGQRQDLKYQKQLNLVDKTLPISVATAPQLRARRQFSFNGLQYEMSGLLPLPPPPQRQLSRLRAGGGGGGSQERMGTGVSSHSVAKSKIESAGGDGGASRPEQKGVQPKRVTLGDRASLMNGGVRMSRRPELDFSKVKPTDEKSNFNISISTDWQNKEEEHEDPPEKKQDRELFKREKKSHRKRKSIQLEDSSKCSEDQTSGLTSQQSWMLAQSLLRAYGSELIQPTTGDGVISKMDYITLTGLVLGCVVSHALFFLCWYFSWLKNQAVGLRKRFLGNANLWEFFDMEDTSRYSVQTKLVLAPLILLCGLLYCVVNMLHLVVQVVRSDVPRTVVVFVQRVANSGLLGTITMGLAGGGGAFRGRQKPEML
ncbi:uncharacterized protein LOC108103103 [Drosophila eugracilis]|uniref:uncharacterized protein LOC108103103 n=1 Tax=Drosophila eugracilis TaxID=29029 RepID=UPI0007E650DE|nr:uncharacterized protein LOC108103103 [Drosophila eugracilis]